MSIVLSPEGPFASPGEEKDRENTNEKGQPLPYIAPPEGLFPDLRELRQAVSRVRPTAAIPIHHDGGPPTSPGMTVLLRALAPLELPQQTRVLRTVRAHGVPVITAEHLIQTLAREN